MKGKKWNGIVYEYNVIYELHEGNGFVIEFNNRDNLFFEGQYINGFKNGKGKEYYTYKGQPLFEGNYLNGKKNGKGKEYDDEGNLIFEGEYKYNHRIKGKEYYLNNKLRYEGEYIYDKK